MNDAITQAAPDLELETVPTAIWESEHAAFIRLLPSLLATHEGLYVAVHHGCVIAEGHDQVDVAKRAYATAGYVPIYVGLVTTDPPHRVRIHSPRLLLGGGR